MSFLIQSEKVSVVRQGHLILDNVSLTLKEKDFITIIGPNGAGKTTLLKILAGVMEPDSGAVKHKAGLRLGYIPQQIELDPSLPMSVKRFLNLGGGESGAKGIAEETEISHLLNHQLETLSGGEKQRVLLARALMTSPEVLILDEPSQNLDVAGQLAFYQLIERFHQERNLALLMVSHDLHMVMASTRQVICLYHHVCCSGEPQMVAQDPEFVRLFGKDMAHLMAIYQHQHHGHEH